jgi:hypothetical protein
LLLPFFLSFYLSESRSLFFESPLYCCLHTTTAATVACTTSCMLARHRSACTRLLVRTFPVWCFQPNTTGLKSSRRRLHPKSGAQRRQLRSLMENVSSGINCVLLVANLPSFDCPKLVARCRKCRSTLMPTLQTQSRLGTNSLGTFQCRTTWQSAIGLAYSPSRE